MPFADPRARLEHILDAIREIEGFATGRTLRDYLSQVAVEAMLKEIDGTERDGA